METDVARRKAIVWDIERKWPTMWCARLSTKRRGRLLALLRQECDHHGQQHLQWLRWEDVWLGQVTASYFPKPSWLGDPTGQQYLGN